MSALTPPNGKYRSIWKIYGKDMNPSETYTENFDKVKWGNGTKKLTKIPQKLDNHYIMVFGGRE
jgi:hypothetical protein